MIAVLISLTLLLAIRPPDQSQFEGAVTAYSAIIMFVPVFEFALQNFKAPLGIVFSDIFLFGIMFVNSVLLIKAFATRRSS